MWLNSQKKLVKRHVEDLCQLLDVGSWVTWFISSRDKNNCCYKLRKLACTLRMDRFEKKSSSFWFDLIVVILWIRSAFNKSYFQVIQEPTANNWHRCRATLRIWILDIQIFFFFGKDGQIHELTTTFTWNNNFFNTGHFWVKIVVSLWIWSLLSFAKRSHNSHFVHSLR